MSVERFTDAKIKEMKEALALLKHMHEKCSDLIPNPEKLNFMSMGEAVLRYQTALRNAEFKIKRTDPTDYNFRDVIEQNWGPSEWIKELNDLTEELLEIRKYFKGITNPKGDK